ncbi:hypothetical protein [Tsuneonella sp. HG222]
MAKMTTQAKLDQARAMVTKYEAELASEAIRNNIEAGDKVTFTHGRGDTKKVLTGAVLGVKDEENGRWVAISVGEGFDLTTYKVRTADITSNPDADKRGADAPAAATPTPTAKPAAKGAVKDPLEAE